ncbi:hypothetical protein KRMM14A1259_68650 [Krasilnikovia sp. MM14-A1259]
MVASAGGAVRGLGTPAVIALSGNGGTVSVGAGGAAAPVAVAAVIAQPLRLAKAVAAISRPETRRGTIMSIGNRAAVLSVHQPPGVLHGGT